MPRRVKIFFDGGHRGDPARVEIAVVAAGLTTIVAADPGGGTSSDAEWLALIEAIQVARSRGLADIVLVGDCADVIAKAKGAVPCRGDAARHLERFRALAAGIRCTLRQVKRSQNLAGIALARRHQR